MLSCDNHGMRKWGRWVWIAGAVAVAAALGFVFAVVRDIRTGDPAVQGAIVGAIAGVAGGTLGATITAWTTRQATAATLAEAHESSVAAWGSARDDRDEARAARFADRVRELAAQMLDSAQSYTALVFLIHERAGWVEPYKGPLPSLESTFGQVAQELRLIVRLSATYEAVVTLASAVTAVNNLYDSWIGFPEGSWTEAEQECRTAMARFEAAVRAELGRPQVASAQDNTDQDTDCEWPPDPQQSPTRDVDRPASANRTDGDTDSGEGAGARPGAS
jgi:hypothetical protein